MIQELQFSLIRGCVISLLFKEQGSATKGNLHCEWEKWSLWRGLTLLFQNQGRALQSAESMHFADWIALVLKQQGVYSISAERFLLLFRAKRYFSTTCWQGWCLHCIWEQWSICGSLTLLFLIQGHSSPISIEYEFCWVENSHSDSSESVLYLCREIAASTTLHCIWEQWSLT